MQFKKTNSLGWSLPELLLVLALLGMATGLFAWTSVPLLLLFIYCLLLMPLSETKNCLRTAALFWIGCAFFIWNLITEMLSASGKSILPVIVQNSAWVGLPFCFLLLNKQRVIRVPEIVFCFTVGLACVSCISFLLQVTKLLEASGIDGIFYHRLLAPFGLHAVIFSVYILFCLLYWYDHIGQNITSAQRKVLYVSLGWLLLCVFLLSSKLCISFLIVFAVLLLLKQSLSVRTRLSILFLVVCLASAIVFVPNPIRQRFAEVRLNMLQTWEQKKFNGSDYLDGLSFRLLQWRWVPQGINKHEAWFTGLGATKAQEVLDEQYRRAGLFMGDGITQKGYGAFNTHNSFLQVLLEKGLVGLLLFGAYLAFLIKLGWQQQNKGAFSYLMLLLLFCCTDSLAGSQWGLMLLLLLPQLLLYGNRRQ